MRAPLVLPGVTKAFEGAGRVVPTAQGLSADVQAGEFVCLLGHAGCGTSTVLSMIAGPDRAAVHASPRSSPWSTVRQTVRTAIDRARGELCSRERADLADRYLDLLGVGGVADRRVGDLAPGMLQCVELARAMAVGPRLLLLDEPFSRLDSMTRFELQDLLAQVWDEEPGRAVLMATDDVDEALYLADRILLMREGPPAGIGGMYRVPFSRPRTRATVLGHPGFEEGRACLRAFLAEKGHQSHAS